MSVQEANELTIKELDDENNNLRNYILELERQLRHLAAKEEMRRNATAKERY